MSPLRAVVVAAAVVPLLAAAEPYVYRCEARGGPAWHEYRTAHFLVATDLSGSRAEAVVRDLERLHALVVQALVGEVVDIPGKVRVVVFADPRDFERIAPREANGYAGVGPLLTPTVVFASEGFQADPEVIAHELAHHVSWYLFPRQPRWFAEGLAQFVQTVARPREETVPKTGTHIVRGRVTGGRWAGLVNPDVARWFRDWGGRVPPDLLTWSGALAPEDSFRYHAWSWLLYHWMWNTRAKAFTEFTARLSNAADPAVAWRECFPDLDPSKPEGAKALADTLDSYRRDGQFASYEVKAAFDARFSVSPLAPAEVHMLIRQARASSRHDRAEDAAELEEALREDALHPIAGWYAAKDPAESRAALAKTVAARPDDWRAWTLLSYALDRNEDRGEKEAALRKALALRPDNASVRNALAWLLVQSGRAKEALPQANAAADLAPWSPEVIDTLATVAAGLGKCAEARVLQRRALDLLGSGHGSQEKYERKLADVEARCGADGAAKLTPTSAPP